MWGEKIHNLLIHPVVLTLLPKGGKFGESGAVYQDQRVKMWSVGRRLRWEVGALVLMSSHRKLPRSHVEAQFWSLEEWPVLARCQSSVSGDISCFWRAWDYQLEDGQGEVKANSTCSKKEFGPFIELFFMHRFFSPLKIQMIPVKNLASAKHIKPIRFTNNAILISQENHR